ncbi:MAG: rhomboid family intramembrane serine protease [Planctomycetales bacterium]
MGYEDRDYYKDDVEGGGFLGRIAEAPVCRRLLIINCAVFVLQLLIPDPKWGSFAERWFALVSDSLSRGEVWRLVTYSFLHDGPWHLVWNMLALWFIGRAVEQIYGSREFLWIYLTAAVVGGLGYILSAQLTGGAGMVVGASGAVMAIFMIFVMHYPRAQFYIWGIFPIEARWMLAIFLFMDLAPLLQSLSAGRPLDHVAHAAHLSGLLYGYFYVKTHWTLASPFQNISWLRVKRVLRRSPKLKVFSGEEQNDEQMKMEVDRLLAKISEQGEASLTDKERKFLMQASKRFRQR